MKKNDYLLVGYLNLFNLVPDFMYPVYDHYGQYYFADGDAYNIRCFVKVKQSVIDDIKLFNHTAAITRSVNGTQIYIYQLRNGRLVIGTGNQVYEQLKSVSESQLKMRSELMEFFNNFSKKSNIINGIFKTGFLMPNPATCYSTFNIVGLFRVRPSGIIPKVSKRRYLLTDAKIPISENLKYYGTGRRKTSVARVYLVHGTGRITINKRDIDDYLGLDTLKIVVRQPLEATDTTDKFDVIVNVKGGGYSGQAGAIRHGIARALMEANPSFRSALKSAGFLTRDSRMKERKKYGLKAARKAPQFSKR